MSKIKFASLLAMIVVIIGLSFFLGFSLKSTTNPTTTISSTNLAASSLPTNTIPPKPTVPATINGPVADANRAEAMQGKVQVSKVKQDLIQDFKQVFPELPELKFIDGTKPVCAALVINAVKKDIKAQCFDTMQDLEQSVKTWM